MRILSLRDPWTFAVFSLGKHIENRKWSTPYRGPILIHRAKSMTIEDYCSAATWIERACGHKLPNMATYRNRTEFGCIVGAAIIEDVTHNDRLIEQDGQKAHPWRMKGQYGFVLTEVTPFEVVVPWKGAQGLRDVNVDDFQRALDEAHTRAAKRAVTAA